jgi:hypothetical protein
MSLKTLDRLRSLKSSPRDLCSGLLNSEESQSTSAGFEPVNLELNTLRLLRSQLLPEMKW